MTESAQPNDDQILIVGAGPAGVTCGLEILSQHPDAHVRILEASHKVGGISRTVCVQGNRMDIGGHRFFTKNERILDLWNSILPQQGAPTYDDAKLGRTRTLTPGGPDPSQTDRVMLRRHRVSRIFYDNTFFDYPLSLKPKTLAAMGFGRTISVGCSYLASTMHKLPETSLENFYINRFGKKLYSMFFEGYTEKVWGRHPSTISADWGSQRVKGLSILAVVKDMLKSARHHSTDATTETSLIKEFLYPKFGPGQLYETIAQEFCNHGGEITYGMRVNGINISSQGTVESICCQDEQGLKQTIPCTSLVSSMPLVDLAQSIGTVMPDNVRAIAEGLPYRDFVTVGLLVNKLSIKNQTDIPTLGNIVPDNWIYVQDDGVKLGRLQIFNNWSPYLVEDPDNTVWIGLEYFCDEGDSFWTMAEEDCIDLARQELIKIGVIDPSTEILMDHRERVQKAYPAYFDTYAQIGTLRSWLKSVPNLYCIGRNGQHRYNNMDHSMLTGLLAADAICGKAVTQDDIWNVNTEEGYQEGSAGETDEEAESTSETAATVSVATN